MSTKKWVIGNFITGQVTEADILPTIAGSGKVTLNINSEDYATVNVSKRDLPNPAEWKTYLKPGYKLVALIDTSKAWNAEGAVLFAGFIKEVRATARETIALQIAGFREYASNRVVLSAQTGSIADPKASKTFTGSTWTNVLNNIANGIWDATGLPTAAPKPPTATKGTVGSATGTGKSAVIENVNTMRFSDALDYVRDDLSDKGEEYRFVPRWQNSSKNSIVWDFVVGTAAAPQINFNRSFSVNLDGENYSIGLGNSLSLTDYATRIVGMSTQTEDATDLTLYNSGSNTDLLIDDVFNPGVELTSAQLNTFTTERLNSQKLLQEEGELLVVSNADETWMTRVGASVSITGGAGIPEVSGMTFNMRLVEVSFSDSNSRVETRVMMNRARFGKLPNSPTSRNKFDNPSINTGVGGGGPITPKLPDNTPPIGGGGGVQLPDFSGNPLYPSTHSVFSGVQSNIYANFSYAVRNNVRSNEFYWVLANPLSSNGDGQDTEAFGDKYGPSLSHASWEACDSYFETQPNMTAMLNKKISITKAVVNGTHNFPQTPLFNFKYSDYLTLEDFEAFNGKAGAYMEHSTGTVLHGAKIYTSSFIDNDTYYLAVFLIKLVTANQSNLSCDALHTQSHKIFKNSISTGTSSTWEDTGWDNAFRDPDDGKPLLPTDSKDIVVRNGKLWMASGVKYKDWVYKNYPNFWTIDFADIKRNAGSTPPAHEWQDPLIKNGIYSLDLSSGLLEKETNSTFTDLSSVLFIEKTGNLSYKPTSWPSGAYTWTANPNSIYRLRDAGANQEIILLQTPGIGGQGLGDASLAAGLNNFVRLGRLRLLPGQPPQTVLLAEANLGNTGFNNGSSGPAIGSIEDWLVLVLPDGRCWWTKNSGGSFIESSEDPSYVGNIIKTRLPNIDAYIAGFTVDLNTPTAFALVNSGGGWIFSAGGKAYSFAPSNNYRSYDYNLNF